MYEKSARHATIAQKATVRDAVFSLLRDFGIDTIFGNPGSTELPMFRDFPKDFQYVLGLQESVVLGMADGYAQARRNAAMVNLHSSAGVGHALGNLFTAYRNQTPIIVTAGQQARSILPFEPFLYAQQATEFPKPFVKWAIEPARAEDVPAAIARAYYVAMQPPRGPVFVSVPIDDWDRPCEPVTARQVSRLIHGDRAMLADAAAALNGAQNPVIVAGAGVARDDAWDEIIALAEAHQAPVWAAPFNARNSFPEDHPLFAGFLMPSREMVVANLAGHDLILVLGAPVFTYHVEGFGPFAPEGSRVIQIVDDPAIASWAPLGTAIVSSLKPAIGDLAAASKSAPRPAPKRTPHAGPLTGEALTDAYLLQQIDACRPRDSIIVEEAPSSRHAMHDRLPIYTRDTFYTCASGGLGHGLPAAVGVAMGRPGEKVIAVIGDGSAMYAIQGLWNAAQAKLPITFVIFNNGKYEALLKFGKLFELENTPGSQLPGIDFCALAASMGLSAQRVERVADLDAALTGAFASSAPNLVEVMLA